MEKRKYKTQKQTDLDLCKAYQKGILDERKEWKEKEKKFNRKIYIEKRQKEDCFCRGQKLWRPMCEDCQRWFKGELNRRIKLVKKKYKPTLKDSSWEGVKETILDAEKTIEGSQNPPKESNGNN